MKMKDVLSMINKNPEYFMTVVEEKSISKAAEKLYISQSYLSQYILKLEKAMDVSLLDRTKSPITVTEAGRVFYSYLESSYRLYEKLTIDFDSLNKKRLSTLNLGFAPWRGSTLLPDILPIFMRRHPNVQVVLHEQHVKEIYTLIEKNIVEVGIMNASMSNLDKLQTEFITHENIVLVANKKNQQTERLLAQYREKSGCAPIDISFLRDECFILIKRGLSCAEWVNNYIANNGLLFKKKIITTSKTTAINLVSENLGFCFIPETGIHWAAKASDLVFFNLRSPDLLAPLVAVYKKNAYLSSAARGFIDIAKNYYTDKKNSIIN